MDNENEILINVALSPLALKLRTLRLQKNFSPETLSVISGVAAEDILSFETDKAKPSDEVLHKLLTYLT